MRFPSYFTHIHKLKNCGGIKLGNKVWLCSNNLQALLHAIVLEGDIMADNITPYTAVISWAAFTHQDEETELAIELSSDEKVWCKFLTAI